MFRDGLSEEGKDGVCELLLGGVELIMRYVFVHDSPKALNWV